MNESELTAFYKDRKPRRDAAKWNNNFLATRSWPERSESLIKVLEGSDKSFQESAKKHPSLEPVDWVAIGINHIDHQRQIFALGRTVSLLMDRQPDVEPMGTNPNRLLFNLLTATISFFQPEDTARTIQEMYERSALRGSYKEHQLTKVLLGAMQYNQIDTRYLELWRAVLNGTGNSFLPITPKEAVHGVLWTPKSEKDRGSPNVPEVRDAWIKYGAIIERQLPEPEWAKEFDDCVEDALHTYIGRPQWRDDLFSFTQHEGWRPWMSQAPKFRNELEVRERLLEYGRSLKAERPRSKQK